MMLFVLSAIVTAIAFGIALRSRRSVAGIDWTALALLGLVAVVIAALVLLGAGTSQLTWGAAISRSLQKSWCRPR